MVKNEVDEYLQQGIYGIKEIKPEERKKYLGTLRERVIAVLYQSQVSGNLSRNRSAHSKASKSMLIFEW